MKEKAHLLVVEDKSLIYKKLKMLLKSHYYSVDAYTPSVEKALAHIQKRRPDLVLLDIDLQGEQSGIELGQMLHDQYYIPFIYVTDFDDDQTFYEALQTHQTDFISKKDLPLSSDMPLLVSTKPQLDEKRLIRAIQMVLNQSLKVKPQLPKELLMVYPDYVQKTKEMGVDALTQIPIPFKEILYFTTNSQELDPHRSQQRQKKIYKKVERNNARVYTWLKKSYILPQNLSTILGKLPPYFARISEDYIVNLHSDFALKGRINGKRLLIEEEVLEISDRYKSDVEKRLSRIYENMK
ncbi:MAG: response regulator transcription factor [Flavobacteriaceae bacterium]|nr:response regulator transcription factor [Flavobacteriaceae bacterium]